ncbi:MAG: zinc-dependent metalloprotease family protein [Bacteroidia bacterium]|nr:zinc-dependent metalloprotease family protein [Bacteroidia bacterium]
MTALPLVLFPMRIFSVSCCLFLCWLLPMLAQAQPSASPWKSPDALPPAGGERRIVPEAYRVVELDLDALRSLLAQAPMEFSAAAQTQAPLLDLPMPDGSMMRFRIWESPVMAPGLAARYPEIRTYAGRAASDPSARIRFDLTPQGFHALMVTRQQGTVFIDPLYHAQDRFYQVYTKADFGSPAEAFSCGFSGPPADGSAVAGRQGIELFGDCSRHIYRLALSCTGEYAQFHGGTVPLVLGAMVTTVNRVSDVFEQDFAVRMNLIDATDTLIFLDPLTDPFTNDDGGMLIGENMALTDSLIGDSAYDIGHVFGTAGGGAAFYAVVCEPFYKSGGFTGLTSPVGDPFDIDYVAHEIGHQFSGSHPFRGCGNTFSPDPSAVEPGSGSTIMAYAGICGDNVQNNSDAYFHGYNLEEMSRFIVLGGGQSCGVHTAFGNTPPAVSSIGQAYVIPAGTPFFLTAQATDPDGDSLTYCWEQFDSELSPQPPLPGSTGGPNFRTLLPASSPTRYFPSLAALAAGGPFTWEVLPTVSRELNFRVSVRDNAIGGSCTAQDSVRITVSGLAGPFVVTNPSAAGISWTAGGQAMVYWNTGNTQFAPVVCTEVDILLSTDGGLSYPVVLAAGVPNDGLYPVLVPQTATGSARVMVRCAGSIFFDVSDQNFSIEASNPGFLLNTAPQALSACGQDTLTLVLNVGSTGGFAGPVALAVSGLPPGAAAVFDPDTLPAGGQALLTLSGLASSAPGLYPLSITGTGAGGSQTAPVVLSTVPALPGTPVQPVVPVNGAVQVQPAPWLVWSALPGAGAYTVEVADNPGFAPLLFQQAGISGSQYQIPVQFPLQTTLYWRVKAGNACGEGAFGPVHQFTTAAPVCTTLLGTGLPLFLNPAVPDTVLATVNMPAAGVVTDVNLPMLRGTHDYMRDLRFSLISPGGTKLLAAGPVCEGERDFDFGFDDQATAPYSAIPCPPTSGWVYQPKTPLAVFSGENAQGVWTLEMADVQEPDGGSLTDWRLEICYARPVNSGCSLSAVPVLAGAACAPCAASVAFDLSNATGAAAYVWNDGATGAPRAQVCEGSYTVTVVDAASCTTTVSVLVPPPAAAPLTASASATPAQDASGGTATALAAGGLPPYRYLWSSGDTSASAQQLPPGTYTVTVTDANGCTDTASAVVEAVTGIGELMGLHTFRLMPNPARGQFLASFGFAREEDAVVELHAASGQCLQRTRHRGRQFELAFDLGDQAAGLYLISVQTAQGRAAKQVLLVR